MASRPRFTLELALRGTTGVALSHLSDNSVAHQELTVRNETNRPYHVQAWSRSQDSRVWYPQSAEPEAKTVAHLQPSGVHIGIEEIQYQAGGHPTPLVVEIALNIDWRFGARGAWDTTQLDSAYITCQP